jgi:hypothetical protein
VTAFGAKSRNSNENTARGRIKMASLTTEATIMQITAVNVLNSNDFPLEDGFDGIRYTFEPGRAITIPAAAAKHIFGWDEQAPQSIYFPYVAARWGWDRKDIWPRAEKWLRNFALRPIRYDTILIEAVTPAFEAAAPASMPPPDETVTVEIVPKPSPERPPKLGSLERRRELTRRRVARFRARKKVRGAAE